MKKVGFSVESTEIRLEFSRTTMAGTCRLRSMGKAGGVFMVGLTSHDGISIAVNAEFCQICLTMHAFLCCGWKSRELSRDLITLNVRIT